MLRQFNNISSWRQHVLTIEPHEVYTLNFRDTLPNIFVLHNPNMSTLKIGISSIPRSDAYEFKIEYDNGDGEVAYYSNDDCLKYSNGTGYAR